MDEVLHKDFRVTKNGFMGTLGVTLIDKEKCFAKNNIAVDEAKNNK